MRNLTRPFAAVSFGGIAWMIYLLVTYEDPDPGKTHFFSPIKLPGRETPEGGILENMWQYLISLDNLGWLVFGLGLLLGIVLFIGIPELLDRFGGDGWKSE